MADKGRTLPMGQHVRPKSRATQDAEALFDMLDYEYHEEPNVGHGTGTSRECAECVRFSDLVLITLGFERPRR